LLLPVMLVLAAIGVAIVKPWASGMTPVTSEPPVAVSQPSAAPATAASSVVVRRTPAPTAGEPALDPLAVPCLTYSEWRAMGIERTVGQETRRWLVVFPVAARGPTDPAIPRVQIVSDQLQGLGFCAPDSADIVGPPSIYLISGGVASLVSAASSLRLLVPQGKHAANIYNPPAGSAAWPAGRYVLRISLASPVGARILQSSVWFAIQVVDAPTRLKS
jgi:hypothetical protein